MPELPEVETIVRDLAPLLLGRAIVSVEVVAPLVCKTPVDGIRDQRLISVTRHGKNVILECHEGLLSIHLGMTGKLLVNGARTPYTRVVFHLDEGELLYDDVRQFGRVHWHLVMPERLSQLGPDPLSIGPAEFVERLGAKRGLMKPILLNQNFLRGLGNIYVDEALFRARIHPQTVAQRLSKRRALQLHTAIQDVLRLAIEHRGSSISDYVDASGQRGAFQQLHQVYAKEGVPCSACGTPIRRIVVAQRGTHFCPKCQRR